MDIGTFERHVRGLIATDQFTQAEALVRPHLASGSGPITLWQLLVECIRPQGKIAETRAIQEMIVATTPGDYTQRFNLSETLLLSGEFARGWREYHHRYHMAHTDPLRRRMQLPRWDGQPMPGKTLLIHDEQGFGDTFQFLRMVQWARERSGARIILEVKSEVLSLAKACAGYDEILTHGSLPPVFDRHCELMSLPMVLGLKLSDLPGQVPYLRADPQRIERWQKRLAALPRPWVALVWAGRPTHNNDRNRSITLAQLAPLATLAASFIAIQKGPSATQAIAPPEGMSLTALGDEIADFADTAAILSIADVLISVDSSPVHLAGALGCEAWVMLPMVPDWRWLLHRDDTPWYPNMKLFRQTHPGDWAGVITRLASELADRLARTAVPSMACTAVPSAAVTATANRSSAVTVTAITAALEPADNSGSCPPATSQSRSGKSMPYTLWLTGLSAAGKTTLANALEQALRAQDVPCEVLDGDVIRREISRDLGFSKEDRSENIRRVAARCRDINARGAIAIAALISPYAADRAFARQTVGEAHFVEIFMSTSLAVCEARDPKGLYRKARSGEIPHFTGVSDPYEVPVTPELSVDTGGTDTAASVAEIVNWLGLSANQSLSDGAPPSHHVT